MDTRARELVTIGDSLFSARGSLLSYWQEIAENFYPERADFTSSRSVGSDLNEGLFSSEPVLIRRELANMLQAMLRPDGSEWFDVHVTDEAVDEDPEAREWLEYMSRVQRRAMYHRPAQFVRATKEGDNDFVSFGQAVIEVDVNRDRTSLLYRCGHLRDHAWAENESGDVDTIHRKWVPTARQLRKMFPGKVSAEVEADADRDPMAKVNCRRIVMPRDEYDLSRKKTPGAEYVSIYIDMDHETILEEYPILWNPFVVPRWQTVSGSQYAWSPCTGPGLADARTLQALVRILLEAGEKAVDPPMLAVQDAIRSDVALYPGGITWTDIEYDERLGEILRPVANHGSSGMPLGLEMADRLRNVLSEGFFLNKITLPQDVGKMTAYEVQKRLEEYVRAAAPLLAPAEDEYNRSLCDRTFDVLRVMKAFGPEQDIPEILQGREIQFEFRSPLRSTQEEMKARRLMEGVAMVGQIAAIDPAQTAAIDYTEATRDALRGSGFPATWLAPEGAVDQARAAVEKQKMLQQGMGALGTGAQVAEQMGKAGQAMEAA